MSSRRKPGNTEARYASGAGDGFSGAFLYFFLTGDRLYSAAEKASRLADYVAGHGRALPELDESIKRTLGLSVIP